MKGELQNNDDGASEESGWTMYFDESSGNSEKLRNVISGNDGGDIEDSFSSSMVSDASSGPQQSPAREASAQAEGSQEGFKRRKTGTFDGAAVLQSDSHLLEDTASSCVSRSFQSDVTVSNIGCGSAEKRPEAVQKRIDFLQSMLPDTPEMAEETLGIAIEYIAAMEQRIQVLEKSGRCASFGEHRENESAVSGFLEKAFEDKEPGSQKRRAAEGDAEKGLLRKRGLCLVPNIRAVSVTLRMAFYCLCNFVQFKKWNAKLPMNRLSVSL